MVSFHADRHDQRYSDSGDAEVTHFGLTDNLALFYYESEWEWTKQNQYQLSANEDTKMWNLVIVLSQAWKHLGNASFRK